MRTSFRARALNCVRPVRIEISVSGRKSVRNGTNWGKPRRTSFLFFTGHELGLRYTSQEDLNHFKDNGHTKVFVAMSGGVDSSVAAGMMKEAGHEVVGVTMCFSINHPGSRKPSCCGVDGIQDAQRAAQILGIPRSRALVRN